MANESDGRWLADTPTPFTALYGVVGQLVGPVRSAFFSFFAGSGRGSSRAILNKHIQEYFVDA
jgi:hypothetical protein